jgi:hypothetical protein
LSEVNNNPDETVETMTLGSANTRRELWLKFCLNLIMNTERKQKGNAMFKVYLPPNTVLRPESRTIIVVACLVIFMVLFSTQVKARQEVSVKEIKNLIPVIEKLEKKLSNVYIESESWSESKMNPADPWKKTAYYIKGNSWISGLPSSKMRVDVLKETMGRKGAKSANIELSYSVGYNGLIGKRVNRKVQKGTDIKYLKEAEIITAGRPKELSGRILNSLSGKRFSMPFFFSKETYRSFSKFLRLATSEEVIAKTPLKFTREEFLGVDCLKIAYADDANNSISWWFEPGKGYALRGYKLVNSINTNGRSWLVSLIKVTKLEEAAENIWYPIEAFEEIGPSRDGDSYRRVVYGASKVIANAPGFDEEIFDIDIPEDFDRVYRGCGRNEGAN